MAETLELSESEYRKNLLECFGNARVGPYIVTQHQGKPALLKFPVLISDLKGIQLRVWENHHYMIDILDKIYSGTEFPALKEVYNQMYQDFLDGLEIMSHPGREMIKGDFIIKVYDNEEQLLRDMNLSHLPTKLVPLGVSVKARAKRTLVEPDVPPKVIKPPLIKPPIVQPTVQSTVQPIVQP